ncbi:DUF4062 domain-containing protein [Lysinibacillus telephonicus]|uniref:DUF4062 domain-containing protein n=1 Tax=Lysinibacillus telephonicus TaxID=1714840 RepID=UPI0031FDFEC2
MINRTRIFISSAYEADLKSPRKIIKECLEESGHEVPIFETGDFGTWETDTLEQCLQVVRSSDIFILLINRKSGASPNLMSGNITATYREYQTARNEKKHILVFVSPDIKRNFDILHPQLKVLYQEYLNENHRIPKSPYDPFQYWIENCKDVMAKEILSNADPFVWAFLFDIYSNREWLYEFDFSDTPSNAKIISQMLSTSFRSVVSLISEKDRINQLKKQASYLLSYADYTIELLHEKNLIMENLVHSKEYNVDSWSNFLEKGIKFLKQPRDIVQAPNFNPIKVNTITCFAASLYLYNEDKEKFLHLVGTTGEISAPYYFSIDEEDIFVVEAFTKEERIIAFREEKQTIYLTEPVGNYVFCLHFSLDTYWTGNNVMAYVEEIESAIINAKEEEYFFEYFKSMIGGVL